MTAFDNGIVLDNTDIQPACPGCGHTVAGEWTCDGPQYAYTIERHVHNGTGQDRLVLDNPTPPKFWYVSQNNISGVSNVLLTHLNLATLVSDCSDFCSPTGGQMSSPCYAIPKKKGIFAPGCQETNWGASSGFSTINDLSSAIFHFNAACPGNASTSNPADYENYRPKLICNPNPCAGYSGAWWDGLGDIKPFNYSDTFMNEHGVKITLPYVDPILGEEEETRSSEGQFDDFNDFINYLNAYLQNTNTSDSVIRELSFTKVDDGNAVSYNWSGTALSTLFQNQVNFLNYPEGLYRAVIWFKDKSGAQVYFSTKSNQSNNTLANQTDVLFYPVPFNDQPYTLEVSSPISQEFTYKVFDSNGNILLEQSHFVNANDIFNLLLDPADFQYTQGSYYVHRVEYDDGSFDASILF